MQATTDGGQASPTLASTPTDEDSLTTIVGVGEVKADALREVGIETQTDVRGASVPALAEADGIGNVTGKRIKQAALKAVNGGEQ